MWKASSMLTIEVLVRLRFVILDSASVPLAIVAISPVAAYLSVVVKSVMSARRKFGQCKEAW